MPNNQDLTDRELSFLFQYMKVNYENFSLDDFSSSDTTSDDVKLFFKTALNHLPWHSRSETQINNKRYVTYITSYQNRTANFKFTYNSISNNLENISVTFSSATDGRKKSSQRRRKSSKKISSSKTKRKKVK